MVVKGKFKKLSNALKTSNIVHLLPLNIYNTILGAVVSSMGIMKFPLCLFIIGAFTAVGLGDDKPSDQPRQPQTTAELEKALQKEDLIQMEADSIYGKNESNIILKLGKPEKVLNLTDSNKRKFRVLVYDDNPATATYFTIYEEDGYVIVGKYKGEIILRSRKRIHETLANNWKSVVVTGGDKRDTKKVVDEANSPASSALRFLKP